MKSYSNVLSTAKNKSSQQNNKSNMLEFQCSYVLASCCIQSCDQLHRQLVDLEVIQEDLDSHLEHGLVLPIKKKELDLHLDH